MPSPGTQTCLCIYSIYTVCPKIDMIPYCWCSVGRLIAPNTCPSVWIKKSWTHFWYCCVCHSAHTPPVSSGHWFIIIVCTWSISKCATHVNVHFCEARGIFSKDVSCKQHYSKCRCNLFGKMPSISKVHFYFVCTR